MNKMLIVSGMCFLAIVGIASAEENTQPNQHSACQQMEIAYLKAVQDPAKRVDQEWNLQSAEAAHRLQEIGAQC